MTDLNVAKRAADTIRILSAEAIQQANSGHPGMPMGCADYAFMLWQKYLRHNPRNSQWLGRDRFILSAGHGSMLLYSILHLYGYKLSMEDLKNFRQWESLTPGHPEFGHTDGVEVTTGPLGSGFASAVGMAMAAKSFAARSGLDRSGLFDQKFYVLSSDGCMMEGSTAEAASLAGHLKLDNLICFYDDNSITIEGDTSLAFSEDVAARFESYNWRVINIANANDLEQIDNALAAAQNSDGRPTLLVGKTQIGFGSPNLAGTHDCHGAPLGADELAATREKLGYDQAPFTVASEIASLFGARAAELSEAAEQWEQKYQQFLNSDPEAAARANAMLSKAVPSDILEELLAAAPLDKATATRASGGTVLQKAAELVPALYGGSADLSPSTKTNLVNESSFGPENRAGRNLHFGIRELAMSMAGNGIALYGAGIPYVSTFFVFSDYMKPGIRLASLQKLHIIYVFTHDSFFVGEDGPTHEPIEQAVMLRSIPGVTVLRPAEANEVAHAWATALNCDGPVVILLTRQNLEPFAAEMAAKVQLDKGAYVLSDDEDFELIMIASGSEVNLALESAEKLRSEGKKVRVVSMPSQELFLAQDEEYRRSVLPCSCPNRVTIEAGSTFGWHRFVGCKGLCIGLDHFGASAPYKVLAEKFGFSVESVVERVKKHFSI